MSKKKDNIETNLNDKIKKIKNLSYDELNFLCEDIRKEIISKISTFGGHLASNLGIVESTVALYKVFDFPTDKLIFDVGHQSATHKILSGRNLENLGSINCVSRFQKIEESKYDCYGAGHSSTSISAAEGFALARDFKGENYNVIAVIGDSSLASGLSFEALNNIGEHKVIIILNDNEMSISEPKGNLSNYFRKISSDKVYNILKKHYLNSIKNAKYGTKLYEITTKFKNIIKRCLIHNTTLFEQLGITYIGPVDGHNLKALTKAFNRAKNTTKSTIIHVRTIKGKGYKYSENDKSGYWHGVSPFNLETGKPLDLHPGLVSWSHIFASLTEEVMKQYNNSFLIVPATAKGSGLENSFAEFPDRCIDVGIAEEHALTLAGSLSLNNIHPIVAIYSTFLQRAYDELSHDCARFNSGMTLLIDRAGLVGKDGETHQGIYDVAYLKSIPNVTITMPTNQNEAKQLYLDSFDNYGVFAIRYPREFVPDNADFEKVNLPYGSFKFEKISNSKKLAIVGVGPNSSKLFKQCLDNKLDLTYVNAIYLNPLNIEDIKILKTYENILIYDSYGTEEGFPSSLKSKLIDLGFKGNVITKCLPTKFIKQGSIDELLKNNSLDVPGLFQSITELLK